MSSSAKRSALVLIVDTDEVVAEVVRAILVTDGYDVVAASDGWEACRLIQECPGEIALVVTDVTMRYMDGIELAERLRVINPELPVLLLSGWLSRATEESLGERVEFLSKPFTSQALLSKVNAALEQTQMIPV